MKPPPPDDCSKPPSPLLKPGGGPRTVAFEKTVLVMVRSPTTLVRSADLARHLFSDPRIQVLFTVSEPRSVFSNELELAINKRGLPFVPWKNAVLETYDLALIESALDPLPEIKAPIIMLSHGVGHNSVRSVAGANTAHSNWLDEGPGTILPRIVGLVSEDEARVFGDRCQTEVLGDPVFDSMLQARHRRDEFRDALDIGDRKLVVLSSTWGRLSAFSARPQMFSELLSLLPADEFAIAAILHPNIWMGHGPWQIETWLRDALAGGLKLIPFESGWQATLVAADCLAGDHGSVSTYASMLGTPTCLLSYPEDALNGDLAIVQAMGSNKAVETAREIAEFAETTCRQASRGAQKRPNAAFSLCRKLHGKACRAGLPSDRPGAVEHRRAAPGLGAADSKNLQAAFLLGRLRPHLRYGRRHEKNALLRRPFGHSVRLDPARGVFRREELPTGPIGLLPSAREPRRRRMVARCQPLCPMRLFPTRLIGPVVRQKWNAGSVQGTSTYRPERTRSDSRLLPRTRRLPRNVPHGQDPLHCRRIGNQVCKDSRKRLTCSYSAESPTRS